MEKRRREEGRGIRERAADLKIVWREITKQASKTEPKGEKMETELKCKLTIPFVLFHASCLTDT